MRIFISYPPIESKKGVPLLSQNRQFQWFSNPSYIFPVITASAATLLKDNGFEVIWDDGIVAGQKYQEWFNNLKKEKPDLIVIETKTPVIKRHWQIINQIKNKLPKTKVVLMGDHVTALPRESLENSLVDYVLTGGDYDFMLLNLANYLIKNESLEPGWYYQDNGQIKDTGQFQLNHNLNNLPFIDRELTKSHLYNIEYNIKVRPFAYIMAGRDCPWHKCAFCSWTTLFPQFRVRSPENVLDEIGLLIDRYKVKEVFDDTGTFPSGQWLEKFCQGMIERGFNKKITFSCNFRVDYINKTNASLMKKAGFRLLKIGLESANQETLDRLNKGITVKQIKDACQLATKNGLEIHLTIMVGYPWETEAQALNTLKLAEELMLSGQADILQSTVLIPYPGTPLYKEALKKNWFLINSKDYERYDMSEAVLKTLDMSGEEVIEICNKIYKIFVKPQYIWQRIKKIKNLTDLFYNLRGLKAVFGHLKDFSL